MRAVAIVLCLLAGAMLLGWSLVAGEASAPPSTTGTGRTALPADAAVASLPTGAKADDPATGSAAGGTPADADAQRSAAPAGTAPPAFEIRVVSPDKQPVPDAELSWLGNPALVVRTDADGRGTLPVKPDQEHYLLRIASGARHVQGRWDKPRSQTITLPWYGPLRGRVVDAETGEPVAGVHVEREHGSCKECPKDVADADEDGAFTLPAVPRGQGVAFWFVADGYARQYDERRLPGDGDPVDCTFRLVRGVVVAGRFVDAETLAPVAHAVVKAGGQELCRSPADGSFEVRLVPDTEGRAYAEVTRDGYCRHSWWFPSTGGPADYPLLRATTLTGSVRSTTGAAVEAASVRPMRTRNEPVPGQPPNCRIQDAGWNLRASTDADGRFELDGLVPGAEYQVRAGHLDFERPTDPPKITAARDMAPVVLVLQPKPESKGTGVIAGTFRVNGQPTDGRIEWRAAGRHGSSWIDREGAFRLQGVPAGTTELTATADRFQGASGALADALSVRRSVQLAVDGALQLELDLVVDEAPITGRVVRPDGAPVANHWLWARHQRAMWFRAMTGDDGAYSLPVPRLVDAVTVGGGEDAEPKEREVAPGTANVDFVLPTPGELRYRVTTAAGIVRWVNLTLVPDGGQTVRPNWAMEAPDQDGWRTLTAPRGDYTVLIAARGYAPVARRVALGERATLDVAMPPGVAVTLRLRSDAPAFAEPLRAQLVDECFDDRSFDVAQMSGLERRFALSHDGAVLRHVGPGRHRLRIDGRDDVQLEPATIEVGAIDATFELRWRRTEK